MSSTSAGKNNAGSYIIGFDERILITGAAGFIGPRVVKSLMDHGFRNIACFTRPSSNLRGLQSVIREKPPDAKVEIAEGNLLSRLDCHAASENTALILHLAAGASEKSFSDAFLNSVVTTRNLLDAARQNGCLKRFVNVSSMAVYSNRQSARLLDESCPIDQQPELRGDSYCFAKTKQEQLVAEYGQRGLPYVTVRPGSVYGPGKEGVPARVGIATFGLFLHLGGLNRIPLTYVDNCADAIVLAGLMPAGNGEAFNIVDDDLPSSRQLLRSYKRSVKRFSSIYVPHGVSYLLCWLWERYSKSSGGQLPPVFNRGRWFSIWRRTRYSNTKLKNQLGWVPRITTENGLATFFESCNRGQSNA